MRAPRTALPVLAIALLAVAVSLPAAAGPADAGLEVTASQASVSTDVDEASLEAEAAGVGADVDGAEAVATGVDALSTATSTPDHAFSDAGGGGPAVDSSGGLAPGSPASVSQAAGAASLAVLAAFALAKLEGAAWARRVLGLAVVPLYSRMDRSDILENETRKEMYELIQDEPGVSMQEVADATGCGWGTVVYHLEKLEDEDFVASERTGGRRRFFAAGDVSQDDKEAVGVLRQDTPREIVAYLLRSPGANQSEIREAVDIAASTASKHLGRLEEAGLVTREREWREVHYFPAEGLRERVPSAPEPGETPDGGPVASPA